MKKGIILGFGLATATMIFSSCQKEDFAIMPYGEAVTSANGGVVVGKANVMQLLELAKSQGICVRIWMEGDTLCASQQEYCPFTKDVPDATFRTMEEAVDWSEDLARQGISTIITYNERTHMFEGWIIH